MSNTAHRQKEHRPIYMIMRNSWSANKALDFSSDYDIQGQLIRKIGLGNMLAGVYVSKDKAVYWNGRNDIGEKVTSGIYFYTLQAGDYSATKRMLILK